MMTSKMMRSLTHFLSMNKHSLKGCGFLFLDSGMVEIVKSIFFCLISTRNTKKNLFFFPQYLFLYYFVFLLSKAQE